MTRSPPNLRDLLGLPWWAIGRAANLQWLHFGSRKLGRSPLGVTREVGDYALHVQAPWRVCLSERIVLGSSDLTFPRGTSRLDERPDTFDWKQQLTRLDELAEALEAHVLPRKVIEVRTGLCGSFTLIFEGDLTFEAFPDATVETESWRLFEPRETTGEDYIDEPALHRGSLPGVPDSLDPDLRATRYTSARASVRFMGDSLDPLDVTLLLRLPYDHAHRDGEPRLGRRRGDHSVHEYAPYRQGMWSMSSEDWIRSVDLDAHVRWLLDQLESRAEQVKELLSRGVFGDIYCFASGTPAESPALPEATLARVAALGLEIDTDYYRSDVEE